MQREPGLASVVIALNIAVMVFKRFVVIIVIFLVVVFTLLIRWDYDGSVEWTAVGCVFTHVSSPHTAIAPTSANPVPLPKPRAFPVLYSSPAGPQPLAVRRTDPAIPKATL